jgi:hypothetical protein
MNTFTIDGNPYQAESVIEGILINPVLPDNFYDCPNDERPEEQVHKFWDRPYITVDKFSPSDSSYRQYKARVNFIGITPETENEFNDRVKLAKDQWGQSFPNGTRYTVHCLDGGAWDRPLCWGCLCSIEEAIECCKNGPAWRK